MTDQYRFSPYNIDTSQSHTPLRTNIIGNVCKTVKRIISNLLGVKGFQEEGLMFVLSISSWLLPAVITIMQSLAVSINTLYLCYTNNLNFPSTLMYCIIGLSHWYFVNTHVLCGSSIK